MGHVHLNAQEYEEAVACWDTVLRDHRGSDRASGAAINAASVLLQVLGDPDRAFARLTDEPARPHDHGPARRTGELPALPDLRRAPRLRERPRAAGRAPGLGPAPRADPGRHPGRPLEDRRRSRPPAGRSSRCSSGAADDASALNNLAGTLAAHGVALDTAVAAAARAIVLSGTRHDIWDTYAEALFRSGQIDKAIEAEEKAVALATAQKDQAEYRARLARFKAARKPPAQPVTRPPGA